MKKTYNKLIRDKIPDIIASKGQKAVTQTLNDREYYEKLCEKLNEETKEFMESGEVEELADIGEVMHAILEYRGVSISEFQRIRQDKLEKRGGFKNRILLKEILDESL